VETVSGILWGGVADLWTDADDTVGPASNQTGMGASRIQ